MQSGTYWMSQTWKFPLPLRVHLSIVRLPKEPFFIHGGKETMTTYHQDIMTNFSCVHDRSTVYPFFRVVFQNIHKCTCPCQLFKVFTLKINFTTILFKSNTKFPVILIVHKKTFLLYVTKHKFQDR